MLFTTKYNNEYTNLHRLIHLSLGGILAVRAIEYIYRKILFIGIILYQFGQLFFNVRYFFNKNKFVKGNSVKHTLNKLFDFIIGYCIVFFILKIINNYK